jgi:hypothetical protein
MAGMYGTITAMIDSHKDPEKTEPELTVHSATEPSAEKKVKIAAELGRELSEALERAAREHKDGGASAS